MITDEHLRDVAAGCGTVALFALYVLVTALIVTWILYNFSPMMHDAMVRMVEDLWFLLFRLAPG